MKIVPLNLSTANEFVSLHHRHSSPVVGHRFSIGLSEQGELVGVCIVGRPIARRNDDGLTAEVTRVCVAPNCPRCGCSKLYSAAQRVWFAMGGNRLLTYTLQTETGDSLRGAGWCVEGECGGAYWDSPSRPRPRRKVQLQRKLKWVVTNTVRP